MHRLGILFCATAPSLVLLQYGIAKARARWDDRTIWEAFFSGGMATIFVLLPEMLLKKAFPVDVMSPVHGAVTQAFVIAAIPEEIAKFAAILYAIKRYGAGDDRHDVITTSFAVALGFAAIENLAYLLAPGEWPLLAASRAVLAVPMHGLNGLAMGSFLTVAQFHPRQRRVWLTAALAVPMLLHAGYDFPLMLITRNEAFFGVLPAWFLMVVLSTICVLCLCNKVRAFAERVYVPLNGASSPRLSGAVLLLLVPILASITLVGAGNFGIVGAAAFSILPAILGIDLLRTSSKVSPAATAKR
ncbi:RsiW-degrading membrane proteinase PrsW (M82 family) [Bradyrhizobium sp. AZCC 2289]